MQHINRGRFDWKVYDDFVPMPGRVYRSTEAPTDVTTFEGVMLDHVEYVIYQSQIEKEPILRARGDGRDFGALFGSVWRAKKLPKMPRGIARFAVSYHGSGEISAGWHWRKGNPDAAKKVWRSARDQNPMFFKMIEPLTSMGINMQQQNDVGRLWELHQESLKEYFKAVPRYRPKNLSRPKKVCLAFAAEFGALLDELSLRYMFKTNPVTITSMMEGESDVEHFKRSGIKQNMAEYWWGGGGGGGGQHQDSVLFCKTSEGLLLHLPEEHFLRAMQQKKSVVLKKWSAPIQGKRKKMDKGKQKTTVILPGPTTKRKKPSPTEVLRSSPELPVEVLLQILQTFGEPTPDMRRIIFGFVKPGIKNNWVTEELAKPELVWRWYQQVFQKDPPIRLAHLWKYYVEDKEDSVAFVRQWYSGFVRAYDMKQLYDLYSDLELETLSTAMSDTISHTFMKLLRGRTIGSGRVDGEAVLDYQSIEVEIEKAFDVILTYEKRYEVIGLAMFDAMLERGEELDDDVRVQDYLDFLEANEDDDEDKRMVFLVEEWSEAGASTFIPWVLEPIQALSELAVRIIRGLGKTQAFSVKDYTAMVWLNAVTMNLNNGDDLQTAMDVGSSGSNLHFLTTFIQRLRKEVLSAKGLKKPVVPLHTQRGRDERTWVLKGGKRELTELEEEEEGMSSSSGAKIKTLPLPHFWN